jgi:hypothetical protein
MHYSCWDATYANHIFGLQGHCSRAHKMHMGVVWSLQVLDEKETAVYKRALEEQYKLKMKASRCACLSDLSCSMGRQAIVC